MARLLFTMSLALSFVVFLNIPLFAEDTQRHYEYRPSPAVDNDAEDIDESNQPDIDRKLMGRKKKKVKKGAANPIVTEQPAPVQGPPPCDPPICIVQDPILPDEICNNDCPQGSGRHCEGRHDMSVHQNYAVCVPD